MKNCIGGGKNMGTVTRHSSKSPSEDRIMRLLKKKKAAKAKKK